MSAGCIALNGTGLVPRMYWPIRWKRLRDSAAIEVRISVAPSVFTIAPLFTWLPPDS